MCPSCQVVPRLALCGAPRRLSAVELAFEAIHVLPLVPDHLLEHLGGAVVAEAVSLPRGGVELAECGDLALQCEPEHLLGALPQPESTRGDGDGGARRRAGCG